jgi:putative isomerase
MQVMVKLRESLPNEIAIIRKRILSDYQGMYRQAGDALPYPFLTPGSAAYDDVLWDWDSWLTNIALRQILAENNSSEAMEDAQRYERGCILNFLHYTGHDGWMPILILRDGPPEKPTDLYSENMHKPVLAQHAAFLVKMAGGDAEWLRESFFPLQAFVNNYRNHHRHSCGLYFWQTDCSIGVDNDPCTFYRPPRSSGSIFLNCMMFKELDAMAYLCDRLRLDEVAAHHRRDAEKLRASIIEHCWDERDGFFYSVDLNLLPVNDQPKLKNGQILHSGQTRDWDCLIQRIGVWSGFLALWAGIATPQQAQRVVEENYRDPRTFNAPFGVRTLSRMEQMYNLRGSGNPSSWLGPIWGISNYLTFRGLIKYGFEDDARELAEKTVHLFARDFERFEALHEYYQPENGEPILNRGFKNWNYLVLNMINWLEGVAPVEEF